VTETEEARNRYKDAIKFFERAARGEVSLGLDGLNLPQVSNGSVLMKSRPPVFNADTLIDY
jgi:phage gp36-like protein